MTDTNTTTDYHPTHDDQMEFDRWKTTRYFPTLSKSNGLQRGLSTLFLALAMVTAEDKTTAYLVLVLCLLLTLPFLGLVVSVFIW